MLRPEHAAVLVFDRVCVAGKRARRGFSRRFSELYFTRGCGVGVTGFVSNRAMFEARRVRHEQGMRDHRDLGEQGRRSHRERERRTDKRTADRTR